MVLLVDELGISVSVYGFSGVMRTWNAGASSERRARGFADRVPGQDPPQAPHVAGGQILRRCSADKTEI